MSEREAYHRELERQMSEMQREFTEALERRARKVSVSFGATRRAIRGERRPRGPVITTTPYRGRIR